MTLISLWQEVQPLLYKFDDLYLIYMRGVYAGKHLKLISQKATLLLNTLYNCLITSDTLLDNGCLVDDSSIFCRPQGQAELVSMHVV